MKYEILQGDCREMMRTMPEKSVQTCVTSPPYYGLRDYGHEGQIGLEETPEEYIKAMVEVFRCVWDVLKDDGTLWLNIGDSYYNYQPGKGQRQGKQSIASQKFSEVEICHKRGLKLDGLKEKDLIGIPWMLAFALRADGWYLRQDIIWHKPNPMPESVQDRCTKAHEYIFLLSKSQKYHYDHEAIKEKMINKPHAPKNKANKNDGHLRNDVGTERMEKVWGESGMANKRSVWTVTTKPFSGAHFATFPPDLIEPCILAGSALGDTVLDPFGGSGTTAMVANQLGRNAVLCELNPEYIAIAHERIKHATAQQDLFFEEASA